MNHKDMKTKSNTTENVVNLEFFVSDWSNKF